MSTEIIVAIVVAVVVVAAILAFALGRGRRRTKNLKATFGPEYDRVAASGDSRAAEEQLERRKNRVEQYHLRPLRPEERERFARDWQAEQGRFVDDPRMAVANADRLVSDAMTARGYRLPDMETRIEDLSVQHPVEVENFRAAHVIAQRDTSGQASTEDLRQAMKHYRTIFESLLGQVNQVEEARR